ncbi:hypothetical protein ACJ41O_014537 [Fusarium nematophilum]
MTTATKAPARSTSIAAPSPTSRPATQSLRYRPFDNQGLAFLDRLASREPAPTVDARIAAANTHLKAFDQIMGTKSTAGDDVRYHKIFKDLDSIGKGN